MNDELVIRIDPDGTVVGLSGSGIEEALDLRILGPMKAERAGRIYFDERTQAWWWRTVDGMRAHGGFQTRRGAVADEVRTLSAVL